MLQLYLQHCSPGMAGSKGWTMWFQMTDAHLQDSHGGGKHDQPTDWNLEYKIIALSLQSWSPLKFWQSIFLDGPMSSYVRATSFSREEKKIRLLRKCYSWLLSTLASFSTSKAKHLHEGSSLRMTSYETWVAEARTGKAQTIAPNGSRRQNETRNV